MNASASGSGRGRPLALVLFGVSGSGKTTIGRQLAPLLEATFLEGDDYHSAEAVAKMRSGTPLTDADRAPWLERLGQAVAETCDGGQSVVLACSALRRAYRDALACAARRPLAFVHLAVPVAALDARLRARTDHYMPASLLGSQIETLEPLADDEDGIEIAETGTRNETVDAIRDWVDRRAPGTR